MNVDGLKDEDFEDLKILDSNVITSQAVDFNSANKEKKCREKTLKLVDIVFTEILIAKNGRE